MQLVDRMTQHPPTCIHCGAGNTVREPAIPNLDLQREVNWGDSTYICGSCCMMIAGLYGYISPEQYQELELTITSLKEQRHELRAQLEKKQRRLSAISSGRTALQDERKERASA